jgi:predicted RNA-binding Zn ribbon-like protein
MSRDPARAANQFFGGRVCLDFANSLDWRTSGDPQELIPDYGALLDWSGRRATLPAPAIAALRTLAVARHAEARTALQEAHALRAEIWRAADSLRTGQEPDLAPFNRALATLPSQPALVPLGPCFAHDLTGRDVCEPLWPILWSLTAIMTSDDAHRLGCCQAEGCGWFFVDESPNHSRLWCSSEVCGNRERARRAYAKRRHAINRAAPPAVPR